MKTQIQRINRRIAKATSAAFRFHLSKKRAKAQHCMAWARVLCGAVVKLERLEKAAAIKFYWQRVRS